VTGRLWADIDSAAAFAEHRGFTLDVLTVWPPTGNSGRSGTSILPRRHDRRPIVRLDRKNGRRLPSWPLRRTRIATSSRTATDT
jgi:hypothetical protein